MLQLFLLFSFYCKLGASSPWTTAYPDHVKEIKENTLLFKSGKTLVYNDRKEKNTQELLDNPDIEDQLHYTYNQGESQKNTEPSLRVQHFQICKL
jgi:hypothetical protein